MQMNKHKCFAEEIVELFCHTVRLEETMAEFDQFER